MRLAIAQRTRDAQRFTAAQLDTIKAGVSMVALLESHGHAPDVRKSRPSVGEFWFCCAFHAEKSASLHVSEPRGFFKCFGCGEKGDAIKLAEKLSGESFLRVVRSFASGVNLELDPALIEARAQRQREREAEEKRQRAQNHASAEAMFYAAGLHVAGTPGEIYLREARAIGAPLAFADLRWHARAPLSPYEPAKARRCPAMVARICNAAGEHIGTHLTFLRADGRGKAELPHLKGSRLTCGEHVGGFIRLARLRDACVIGEGIETTLSASEACGLPGLAAINAPNMRAVDLPQTLRRVVIAFDRDARGVGELSADALAQRLWAEGREVEMLAPPDGFKDWNDAAQAGALTQGGERG